MARDLNWSHLIICTISSASHKILYIIVNNKRAATKSQNAANLPEEVHLTILVDYASLPIKTKQLLYGDLK